MIREKLKSIGGTCRKKLPSALNGYQADWHASVSLGYPCNCYSIDYTRKVQFQSGMETLINVEERERCC